MQRVAIVGDGPAALSTAERLIGAGMCVWTSSAPAHRAARRLGHRHPPRATCASLPLALKRDSADTTCTRLVIFFTFALDSTELISILK